MSDKLWIMSGKLFLEFLKLWVINYKCLFNYSSLITHNSSLD